MQVRKVGSFIFLGREYMNNTLATCLASPVPLLSQLLHSKNCTSICHWWSAVQQKANVIVNLQWNDLLPSWWSICVRQQHVCLYKWAGPLCHISLPTFERKSLFQFFLGVKTKDLSLFIQPAIEQPMQRFTARIPRKLFLRSQEVALKKEEKLCRYVFTCLHTRW